MSQAEQIRGRHPSGRPLQRADRRPPGAQERRTNCRRASSLRCSRCRPPACASRSRPARGARSARPWCSPQASPRPATSRPRTPSPRPRARPGLAVVGPNCLGITNNVDGIWLHMLYAREALRGVDERRRLRRPERRPARPFPALRRRPRRPAQLRDLDRQRGGPRNHRLSRIPGRRPRDPRDRALHRADQAAAGIPRRRPARPRRRQAGRDDAGRPRRQGAQGRAVAHRRAGRRLCHHAHAGGGRRRHRRPHHGRDDGPGRNPGALSGPAHQGARHSHRVGRVCRPDQRFRRGHRAWICRNSSRPR